MKNVHIKRVDLIFEKTECKDILPKVLAMKPDEICQEVLDSDLRGRGGAGFPTGSKWRFALQEKEAQKYIVCNADEGEPGTFKDRQILDEVPGKVYCGMAIAAKAIGANIGTTITAVLSSLKSNIAGKRLASAHLIFNFVTGLVALALIFPLKNLVNFLAELFRIAPTDFTLKLALFHTIFNILGVLIMIPFIHRLERILMKYFKEKVDKDISEPKYLNEAVLEFPGTVISSLIKESKFLYKNAIFEIVAHGLNIHREDIKSELKIKKIIKKSTEDMHIDVENLYYKKVKTIYGEILRYATTAQNSLKLTKKQNNIITDIKIANRKMVEIIKDVKELNKNVSLSMNLDNKYLQNEYDLFRKKVTKVLRVIYLFRTEGKTDKYAAKLSQLKKEAKENIRQSTKSMDNLIRKNLINAEMASSLFNDHTNVNDMIKKLIEVAELLYDDNDSLFENSESTTVKKAV